MISLNFIIFLIFAAISIFTATLTVGLNNPVHSAFSMIACLFSIAVTYFTLNAHLVGTLQILVYAGAIMVLFLFVIMLLEKRDIEKIENVFRARNSINFFLILSTLSALIASFLLSARSLQSGLKPILPENFGTLKEVGMAIFKKYIFAFESLSILVLVAIVGVIVLSSKNSEERE
ncbi:MAG: NADH-quinone oxidoreductase subunit J [Candidatus Wallbacteria bacterium]